MTPGSNGRFDGVPPGGDDQPSHFDTAAHAITDPEGIGFDPATGLDRPGDPVHLGSGP